MESPKIVTKAAWLKARLLLLEKEKAFNKTRDQLTRERQALPWVKVEKGYIFAGPTGKQTLADLFEGYSQLIVYHFMYHPSWGDQPCKSCSFWADNFNGIGNHLNARDVNLIAISKATITQIEIYKSRMGWSFKWVSSYDNDFNVDFHVGFTEEQKQNDEVFYNYQTMSFMREEMPGVSVFTKNNRGEIFHTYSTYSRGLDMLNGAYHFLDLVPKGRDEDKLAWSQEWVQRHDEYQLNNKLKLKS